MPCSVSGAFWCGDFDFLFLFLHNKSLIYVCGIMLYSKSYLKSYASQPLTREQQAAFCLMTKATYFISSESTAQFLGFANNASFVENNEYCFISPSLLTK